MAKGNGTCYTIGVGPGDPELITVRALRTIEQCPVIASPRTRQKNMLALAITQQAVDLSDKEILPLSFPMTYDEEECQAAHAEAAKEIAEFLDKGQDVAMLTLGDPSVYATGSYVSQILKEQGYPVVVVPGVPSFCATAASLQTVLTEEDEMLTVIPVSVGMEELFLALDRPGTKVIMKAGKKIGQVMELIEAKGLLEQTQYAENVGLPDERIGPASELPKNSGYFVTLIVTDRK